MYNLTDEEIECNQHINLVNNLKIRGSGTALVLKGQLGTWEESYGGIFAKVTGGRDREAVRRGGGST